MATDFDQLYVLPRRLLGGHDAAQAVAAGEALPLAGGPFAFTHVAILERRSGSMRSALHSVGSKPADLGLAADVWDSWRHTVSTERLPFAGLDLTTPRLMGIVNVTPDSFSDGGRYAGAEDAAAHARTLLAESADIIDIGGESTRPGAQPTPFATECERVLPVIRALAGTIAAPLSIDTRKAALMREAIAAGATIINDVSALSDPDALSVVKDSGAALVLMHMQGEPVTMQDDPRYEDVLLDVYDYLAERIAACETAGIPRARIAIDPGIGFGKTLAHNLRLTANLTLFHGLGCPVLLGASRKGFLGRFAATAAPEDRVPGSLAAVLTGRAQGVQMFRVHDVGATRQALDVWSAFRST